MENKPRFALTYWRMPRASPSLSTFGQEGPGPAESACGSGFSTAEAQRGLEGCQSALAVTGQAQWNILDLFWNPRWSELNHVLSIYPQRRRESVLFLHIGGEEKESGFDEDGQVLPERLQGIRSRSCGVLWRNSRRPGRRVSRTDAGG